MKFFNLDQTLHIVNITKKRIFFKDSLLYAIPIFCNLVILKDKLLIRRIFVKINNYRIKALEIKKQILFNQK